MPRHYVRRGATRRTFFVCPLCARDWKGKPPELLKRVGTFLREVIFAGRGNIRLLKVYHAKDLVRGGSWLAEVRGAVLALARLLGFELAREQIREVVREYTVQRGRRRIRECEERARHWARKRRNAGKRHGRAVRGMGGVLAATVDERWNRDEAVGAGGVDGGTVEEKW